MNDSSVDEALTKLGVDTAGTVAKSEKEAEEAANFLFRHNANRILKRWWGAREAHTPNTAELAGDVLNLILVPIPYPVGPLQIHPYVVQQLGTALKVAKDKALDINKVIELARQDCGL